MYREFKQLNLPEIDKNILEFWEKEKVFEKSVDQRDAANQWINPQVAHIHRQQTGNDPGNNCQYSDGNCIPNNFSKFLM